MKIIRYLIVVLIIILFQGFSACASIRESKWKVDECFPSGESREFVLAAFRGNTKKVKQMLSSGYNIDKPGKYGTTPAMLAAMLKNRKAAILLLENGADPNRQSDTGRSVMHWASEDENPKVLEIAIKHGGNINVESTKDGFTPLFGVASVATLRVILKQKPDLNHQGRFGKTAMIRHAILARFDIVLQLLKVGANPEIKDELNNNLIFFVKDIGYWEGFPHEKEHNEVIEYLKKRGLWKTEN